MVSEDIWMNRCLGVYFRQNLNTPPLARLLSDRRLLCWGDPRGWNIPRSSCKDYSAARLNRTVRRLRRSRLRDVSNESRWQNRASDWCIMGGHEGLHVSACEQVARGRAAVLPRSAAGCGHTQSDCKVPGLVRWCACVGAATCCCAPCQDDGAMGCMPRGDA